VYYYLLNRKYAISLLAFLFLLSTLTRCTLLGNRSASSEGTTSSNVPPDARVSNIQFADGTPFWGARLEPPAGGIFHGAQAELRPVAVRSRHVDWDGIEAYTKACGQRPKLIMHYTSFYPFAFSLLKETIFEISQQSCAYIAQIGLDFYSYGPGFNIMDPKDITHEIARGDHDDKIRELARLFIEMKTPIFLRPGYEFGGNGRGRYASVRFWVSAWKRIFRVFETEGAKDVAFVWHTLDAGNYIEYYPGDEYVDWWAISIFGNHADKDAFLNSFIQDAQRHKKPVMIAESTPRFVGSGQGETSWRKWYVPYFTLISKSRHVKAFCYINASWKDYPDRSFTFDCRIQSNPFVAANYRRVLSDPRFIHARTN
jgi:hypothetical protein